MLYAGTLVGELRGPVDAVERRSPGGAAGAPGRRDAKLGIWTGGVRCAIVEQIIRAGEG